MIHNDLYKYEKLSMRIPIWDHNRRITRRYAIANPSLAASERYTAFRNPLYPNHIFCSIQLCELLCITGLM